MITNNTEKEIKNENYNNPNLSDDNSIVEKGVVVDEKENNLKIAYKDKCPIDYEGENYYCESGGENLRVNKKEMEVDGEGVVEEEMEVEWKGGEKEELEDAIDEEIEGKDEEKGDEATEEEEKVELEEAIEEAEEEDEGEDDEHREEPNDIKNDYDENSGVHNNGQRFKLKRVPSGDVPSEKTIENKDELLECNNSNNSNGNNSSNDNGNYNSNDNGNYNGNDNGNSYLKENICKFERDMPDERSRNCKNDDNNIHKKIYENNEKCKNMNIMKKGYHKRINDIIIDKLVHKTFNNIMKDTSKKCSVTDSPNMEYKNKRSLTVYNDDLKRETKKYKTKGSFENSDGLAAYMMKNKKEDDTGKTYVKYEMDADDGGDGYDDGVDHDDNHGEGYIEYSKNDKFLIYCKNHLKKFDEMDIDELMKYKKEETVENKGNYHEHVKKEKKSYNANNCTTNYDNYIMHHKGNDFTHEKMNISSMQTLSIARDEGNRGSGGISGGNGNGSHSGNWNGINNKNDTNYGNSTTNNNPVTKEENVLDASIPQEHNISWTSIKCENMIDEITFPPIYEERKDEWFKANENEDWHVHKLCKWLYNVKDNLYFNISNQEIYFEKNRKFLKFENSFEENANTGSDEIEANNFVEDHDKKYEDCKQFYSNGDCRKDANINVNVKQELYRGESGNNESVNGSMNSSMNDSFNSSMNGSNGVRVNGSNSGGNSSSEHCNGKSVENNSRSSKNNISKRGTSKDKNMYDKNYVEKRDTMNESFSNDMETVEQNDETVEEFSMVLEDDLVCGTFSKIGNHNRGENEDFYITKDILDLNHVSESDGLCFFSGVFDGHGGSNCARYVMTHLKTNLIAKFRQSFLITCKKQFKEKSSRLNDLSVEIRALYDSCIKGFDMTDKNYIEISKKYDYKDGSTACVVLIYGPDDDGSLKVLCANCGDSGALICHNKKPIKLSLRHKPDLQEERMRILKCGGIIANINGINRIITKHKDKNNKSKEKTFLALSTSRSFGDISYKVPRKIVLCKPFISVYTIDFDMDSFLVLATDGILNVLSDKEIIDIVWKNIHKKPEEAAEEVVKEATRRGSTDDKTCTVIFFYWRKDIFSNLLENASLEHIAHEDSKGEDINMFSEIF
ncbi:protein phosphatase PPM4, putative [Plasmodium malariae]|uniref:Protein phosphatase PPM4, putative n=1 Tax=Plasmodium malariae TaxID=5858 RepID=A0A1D3TFU6_PLAMA|nr:protein phosphatase PPM4, putative [Plasmodium malariae]SCP03764.1 protein phosphatase PPM4, putative [Plasmodium malariae]